MSFLPPVSFGTSFGNAFANPYASPLFEGGGKNKRSRKVQHAPQVTANHRKKHRVGDVVEFSTGRYQLQVVSGKGLSWVSTHKDPTAREYKLGKR